MLGDSNPSEENPAALVSETQKLEITITPTYASLQAGDTLQFQAQIPGSADPRVFWTLMPSLGKISRGGLYRAPAEILFPQHVWVTAMSETAQHRMFHEHVMMRLKPSTAVTSLEMALNPPDDDAALERVTVILAQYPQTTAVIEGHTDNHGPAARNLAMSEQRARAVRERLIHRFGIAPERLRARGFGGSRPLDSNKTPEGRRHNRRVVAVISAPPDASKARPGDPVDGP
jgi:hypothetical protein